MQITDNTSHDTLPALHNEIAYIVDESGQTHQSFMIVFKRGSTIQRTAPDVVSGMTEPVGWITPVGLAELSAGSPAYVQPEKGSVTVERLPLYATPPASGLREENRWQPIKTAPKDRLIDVWTIGYGAEPLRMADCYYDRICDEWRTSRPSGRLMCIKAKYVTHWMNIPAPPAPQTEGK